MNIGINASVHVKANSRSLQLLMGTDIDTGQGGTSALLWDNPVPAADLSEAQHSRASACDDATQAVPLISPPEATMSHRSKKAVPTSTLPAAEVDLEDAFTATRHGRAWVAAIQNCDRVERGDMKLAELKKLYPAEWNSFRNIPGRMKSLGRTISDDWRDDGFVSFLRDKGPQAANLQTLDRSDNDDPHYAAETTQWASKTKQTRNRSNTVFILDDKGVAWTPEELSKKLKGKVKPNTIRKRRSRGWSDAELHANKRLPTPCVSVVQVTAHYSSACSPATKVAGAKEDINLVDYWEHLMREVTPKESAPLTGKERGRLHEFSRYLTHCSLPHSKTDVVDFLFRNWSAARNFVCRASGSHREPETACPLFLADQARHFVNFFKIKYKPVDISTLRFDDGPKLPLHRVAPADLQNGSADEKIWLADHPMSFEEYDRELWRDYHLRGERDAYERAVARWYDKLDRRSLMPLSTLPMNIQEVIIARKGLDVTVVPPPPANPDRPPAVFCPETEDYIYAWPVEHSDPFPDDELAHASSGRDDDLVQVSPELIAAACSARVSVAAPGIAACDPAIEGDLPVTTAAKPGLQLGADAVSWNGSGPLVQVGGQTCDEL